MGYVLIVKCDGAAAADVLAAVSKAAAAGVCDLISAHRAFVAGDLQDLDHVGVILVSAHCELHPLGKNGALLVNAAAHCGGVAGNDLHRNVEDRLKQGIVPCLAGYLAQDFVLKMLNFGIEFSHYMNFAFLRSLKINYFYTFTHLLQTL